MAERSKVLYDAAWVQAAIGRLCNSLFAKPDYFEGTAIVGIRTRGAVLAGRIAEEVRRRTGTSLPLGALDITLYRDDLYATRHLPAVRSTDIPFDIDDRKILLVDDVLYTGRTVRAALDELADFGRPRWIQLAVLLDRGRHELPICADYAAAEIDVPESQFVRVHLTEVDGIDEVVLIDRGCKV